MISWVTKRFLMSNKGSLRVMGAIAAIGLLLSVATFIVTISVVGGFETQYRQSIIAFSSHIVYSGLDHDIPNESEQIMKLSEDNQLNVTSVYPYDYREGLIVGPTQMRGVAIKGLDLRSIYERENISLNYSGERKQLIADFDAGEGIILGKRMADMIGVSIGGTIKLLLPDTGIDHLQDAESLSTLLKPFRVIATFETGLYDQDGQCLWMPLQTTDQLFHMNGLVSGLEISLQDPAKARMVAETIQNESDEERMVMSWEEMNWTLFEAIRLERILFFIVMSILVTVAAFNLIGAIVIRLLYKTKDISILRAIGMTQSDLIRSFTTQGLVIGLIGVLGGIGMGLLLAHLIKWYNLISISDEVYMVSHLPIEIRGSLLTLIIGLSVLICALTSLVAAFKVTRLTVVEGLSQNN